MTWAKAYRRHRKNHRDWDPAQAAHAADASERRAAQPKSGMKAGYKFPVEPCPECDEMVARNKMIRHLKDKHPLVGLPIDKPQN